MSTSSNPKSWLRWWATSPEPRRLAALALAAWLAAAGAPVSAQSSLPVPRYEDETRREAEVKLPPYPQEASLIAFPTQWTTNRIFIDAASLVLGDDGVVLFTLVVRSAGGAENISFEGLRCASGERRVHAYGRGRIGNGEWSPARSSAWRPIEDRGINRYYFEFWRDVFCDGRSVEPSRAALANLRRGGRERPVSLPD